VEARLHVDEARFLDLEKLLLGSFAQPVYAVVGNDAKIVVGDPNFDPNTVEIQARLDGAKADQFIDFLKVGLETGRTAVRAQASQE
jgi:hypothetical protein